jgi:tRNA threonylcarbamoyladenosine biosynthesis protein TsaB
VGGVLGFDTSTAFLTAAFAAGDETLSECEIAPDDGGRPRHAREILGAVEDVIARAGGWDAVDRIAVGVGPGTFTGLRVGIATARALAQSAGLDVVPVSSLEALARGSDSASVLAVIDARRNEAFAALYSSGNRAWDPWVGPPEALAERVRELPEPPLAVGDGAIRFRQELEAARAEVPADQDPRHRLRARHTCAIGARNEPLPLSDIKPTYLRRPDAELWRERDHETTST